MTHVEALVDVAIARFNVVAATWQGVLADARATEAESAAAA